MPLTTGQSFAGYTIIRLLGSGGMGEVYLAQHPRLPRRDALKLLPREWSADDEFRARFNREADLASTLWHPHIVGVHDRGEEDGQLWISMDFVDGLDAARLLADRYPAGMPPEDVVRIVSGVASALDHAHKQALLHRDVKPANIMLTHLDDKGEQRILLTDFGIARNVNDISGLTKTNMTMGTVAYCAPEQLLGENLDGRADQYALAATAYHLFCGSQLFHNSNPAVVISRHLNVPPPALADLRPALAKFDPVLAVGLAKRPEDRFERCSDFVNALAEQLDSASASTPSAPTVSAPRATPPVDAEAGPSRRRRVAVAVTVAVLVSASISAAALLMRQSSHDESARSTATTAAPAASPVTFESMREFVTSYYGELPAHPTDAWAKLDSQYQNQTGQREFVDFWATIQSVTVLSVSPRDASSVVAKLKYVRPDGTSSTETRWLKVVLVNGVMLLDGSDRVGSVSGSPTSPTQPLFSPKAIDQVLLTADQLSKVLGVTVAGTPAGDGGGGLAIESSSYGMSDHSSQVTPRSCVGVVFTGEHDVYAPSQPTEIKTQTIGHVYLGSPGPHLIEQTAAVYPSVKEAQDFLNSSQAQWNTCAKSEVDASLGFENGAGYVLGPVQRQGDLITVSMATNSGENGPDACQQAMGAHGNVIVETRSCQVPKIASNYDPAQGWPRDPAWAVPDAKRVATAMLGNVKP
ncbi:serine/threonine-protein kinase PknH/PknJ [Mycobacterium intracellulare]|nr:serine/threonine-protein kinase PknH/PknJ [Mycobacterium intracellulare]